MKDFLKPSIYGQKLSLKEKFATSVGEFSKVESLTIAGMLLAVRVVLGYFSNFSLTIIPTIKFTFSFLPISICSALLGPVMGIIVGGLGDILSFIINPQGAYFFGWTLNAMLTGLVYGLLLYKNNITVIRTAISRVIIAFVIEVPLGTYWLIVSGVSQKAYKVLFASRALKQLAFIVFEVALILIIGNVVIKSIRKIKT